MSTNNIPKKFYKKPTETSKVLYAKSVVKPVTVKSSPNPSKMDGHPSAFGSANGLAKTSWGSVSTWYDSHLEKDKDTYHEKVIMPNLIRMLGEIKGKHVLDLACGQGYFSRAMRAESATVVGVDISKELIALAQQKNKDSKQKIDFFASSADDLFMVKDKSQDIVVCVLAIQNIEKLNDTIRECSRVIKPHGKLYLVMNHPAFRIPQASDWGFDEENNIQYRRMDQYLSEAKIKIDMTPGEKVHKKFTYSFHRPLQVYIKALSRNNFMISRLEEWESHKKSEKGKRQDAENKARKEIPLFLAIEAVQG